MESSFRSGNSCPGGSNNSPFPPRNRDRLLEVFSSVSTKARRKPRLLILFPPWACYLMLKVKISTFQPCFAGKAWKYHRKTVFSDTDSAGFTKRQTKLKLHQKNLKLRKKWDMTQHKKLNESCKRSQVPHLHAFRATKHSRL